MRKVLKKVVEFVLRFLLKVAIAVLCGNSPTLEVLMSELLDLIARRRQPLTAVPGPRRKAGVSGVWEVREVPIYVRHRAVRRANGPRRTHLGTRRTSSQFG